MGVTPRVCVCVCCLRPLYGAIVPESWRAGFSGSHLAQGSGESVSGRFFRISPAPRRRRVILFALCAKRLCHLAPPHQKVLKQ